ncbi:MAG: ribonuclease P protein component [Syntrophomonadaceae bacterium]|nr:ribonuclease P protein component [Syntrophomonadaceae bacterium]
MFLMLSRKFRISKKKEYKKIYKNGRRVSGKFIIVFVMRNFSKNSRFGVVTSRKLGNAVKRNRTRRKLRAVIRQNMERMKNYADVVIVAKKSAVDADFYLLEKDFLFVMRKAGLC